MSNFVKNKKIIGSSAEKVGDLKIFIVVVPDKWFTVITNGLMLIWCAITKVLMSKSKMVGRRVQGCSTMCKT
jgi:hypothetical protein